MNILPLPLGPALVAAACRKAGHDVVLLNLMFAGDTPSAIQDCGEGFRPEVIGISVRNIDDQNMADPKFLLPPVREVVKTCRRRSAAPIIVGGAGYSIFPYPKWVDAELVELMARAGCREISFGFESGSDPMLASLNKRFDTEEVRTAARMFADAGIFRRGFLLLGGPGETRESAEESLAFADSLNLDALKVTVGVRIYPETSLAATALAEGMLRPDDDLLRPRFYLAPRLQDWLPERIAAYKTSRPWVM
jgi:histone acetyltransferase (RNA polymerase elongator complex component)